VRKYFADGDPLPNQIIIFRGPDDPQPDEWRKDLGIDTWRCMILSTRLQSQQLLNALCCYPLAEWEQHAWHATPRSRAQHHAGPVPNAYISVLELRDLVRTRVFGELTADMTREHLLKQGQDICPICGFAGTLLKAGILPTHYYSSPSEYTSAGKIVCEGTHQKPDRLRSLHPDGWGTSRWAWEDATPVPVDRRVSTLRGELPPECEAELETMHEAMMHVAEMD
jgi:hypothetical protein